MNCGSQRAIKGHTQCRYGVEGLFLPFPCSLPRSLAAKGGWGGLSLSDAGTDEMNFDSCSTSLIGVCGDFPTPPLLVH